MKVLALLIGAALGVAFVMAMVVGSTMYFVRPMAQVGPAAVAPAPASAAPASAAQPAAAEPQVKLAPTAQTEPVPANVSPRPAPQMAPPVSRVAPAQVATSAAPASTAQPAARAKPVELTVTATEWALTPARLEVPAGAPVKTVFRNDGAIEHDVTIPTAGGSFKLVATAGKTAEGTFTIDKPGQYEMVCSIPGHTQAGMKGMLVVTGGGQEAAAQAGEQPRTAAQAQP